MESRVKAPSLRWCLLSNWGREERGLDSETLKSQPSMSSGEKFSRGLLEAVSVRCGELGVVCDGPLTHDIDILNTVAWYLVHILRGVKGHDASTSRYPANITYDLFFMLPHRILPISYHPLLTALSMSLHWHCPVVLQYPTPRISQPVAYCPVNGE